MNTSHGVADRQAGQKVLKSSLGAAMQQQTRRVLEAILQATIEHCLKCTQRPPMKVKPNLALYKYILIKPDIPS